MRVILFAGLIIAAVAVWLPVGAESLVAADPAKAAELFAEARTLDDTGQKEQAYDVYRRAWEADPGQYRALYYAARILADTGRNEEAVAALKKCLASAPDFYPAHNALGLLLAEIGDDKGAVEALREGANSAPEYAPAWRNLARALRIAGDLEAAVGAYERAIALEPSHIPARVNLGLLLGELDRIEEAEDQLVRAVTAAPADENASEALSWLRQKTVAPVSSSEVVAPVGFDNRADPLLVVGSYSPSGLYSPVLPELDDPIRVRDQGIALVRAGRCEEGVEVLLRALHLGIADEELFTELGYARARLGEHDEAAWAYAQAERLAERPTSWRRRLQALALHSAGDLPGAAVALRKAVEIDPTDAHAHHLLGLVLLELHDPAAASRHLRTAVRLDPGNGAAHLAFAAVLAERGREQEAIRAYRSALRLLPGEPEALHALAGLLEAEGRPGEALAAWEALLIATNGFSAHSTWNAAASAKVEELAWAASTVNVNGENLYPIQPAGTAEEIPAAPFVNEDDKDQQPPQGPPFSR